MNNPLLKVSNLNVSYMQKTGWFSRREIYAVRDLSFDISRQEIVGVVGESGCGKSTLAKAILQLVKVNSGRIDFLNQSLLDVKRRELRKLRRSMQMVFQDPLSSLNPRMSIAQVISEPLQQFYPRLNSRQRYRKIQQMLELVELPANIISRYPHQLSGGQCQRVSIARALICRPELIVCDEAVSALDVSVQAQIINLLCSLTVESNMSLLFISHDLRVVRQLCNRVLVMYQGRLVENADCEDLFKQPQHHYTKKLLAAIPSTLV